VRALHRLYLLFSLLFFGYFVSHSQPESHREDLSVFVLTQFDYSYVEVCIHGCVELSLAVSLALSLALSLPLSLSPFPKYACSACPLHSRFRSLSLAIPSTLPPDSISLSLPRSLPPSLLSRFSPPTLSSCPQPPSLYFVRTRAYLCTYPY